jgi:integrase/recombinase XerD
MYKLPEILNVEEQVALLSAPNKKAPTGCRNHAMLKVMLDAGLRASEVINLKEGDIDWRSGRLTVRCGKGGRDRTLWLNDDCMDALKDWQKIRPTGTHFFCTLKSGKMCGRYVREFVKRYAQKKSLTKNVHPHTLRHTFATDLLSKTSNIRIVQKALGHQSIVTTTIYTHIVDQQLESAMKNFRNT